jgi:hypothetical protein
VSRSVEIPWQHPETEDEFRVECSVGEGQPEIRWGDSAQPGFRGEVEVLRVIEDAPGGAERPDLLEAAQRDFDRITERALQCAAEEPDEPDCDRDDFDPFADDELRAAHGN